MVVFCTNIAETSLTIKNTCLIIDSGLVKEGRFDSKLRVTTFETIQISKASANQRKGRAGRTAAGHCIRLYKDDDLIHSDTEPAILRSSLDLVVLQLIYLLQNPLEFPFIDPPDRDVIEVSLKLLNDLSCIDENNDITLRGELIVKLNFDPRFGAFLVDSYVAYGPILDLATTVTAILTTSISLFIMGTTDEDKDMVRKRVSNDAKGHKSDLLYFVFVYKRWHSIGILDTTISRKCPVCHTTCNKENICRPCRAAHSATYLLNNKVLNTIENLCNVSIETIKNARWQLNPGRMTESTESDIIGTYLLKYFPENHGGFRRSHKSGAPNAYLCTSNIWARIGDMSVFNHEVIESRYFMAMSIIKTPGDRYYIDRLHPCRPPVNQDRKQIENGETIKPADLSSLDNFSKMNLDE